MPSGHIKVNSHVLNMATPCHTTESVLRFYRKCMQHVCGGYPYQRAKSQSPECIINSNNLRKADDSIRSYKINVFEIPPGFSHELGPVVDG